MSWELQWIWQIPCALQLTECAREYCWHIPDECGMNELSVQSDEVYLGQNHHLTVLFFTYGSCDAAGWMSRNYVYSSLCSCFWASPCSQ